MGVSVFDSAAGGVGGCPFAPGAAGNLATEDLLYMLDGMGIETGVSLPGVVEASHFLASRLGRALPGKFLQSAGGAATGTAPIVRTWRRLGRRPLQCSADPRFASPDPALPRPGKWIAQALPI